MCVCVCVQAYAAWLGFYNSAKGMGWSKPELVQQANRFSGGASPAAPPRCVARRCAALCCAAACVLLCCRCLTPRLPLLPPSAPAAVMGLSQPPPLQKKTIGMMVS